MAKTKKEKYEAAPQGFFGNRRLVYGILFLLAFFIYANTLNHYLALDDLAVIEQNKFVQKGVSGIPEICTNFYWKGTPSFANANSGIYRPVSMIVFAIEWSFTSGETLQDHLHAIAVLGHWVNVLLYAFLAVLIYVVLSSLLRRYPPQLSFLATLLFIVHPVHTEVVANIKSLDEILAMIFSLLTLEAARRFYASGQTKMLGFGALFFMLAMLSKEGALLFFLIVPLALFFFAEMDKKRLMTLSGALLATLLVWFGLHYAVIHSDTSPPEKYTYAHNTLVLADGIVSQLASAIRIFGRYLLLLVFPHPLRYDYSFSDNVITGFADPLVLLVIAIVLGLFYIAYRNRKTQPVLSFGILFFFISFSLTCNIFFLIGTPMADRLLFMPSLGFCLALAWAVMYFTKGFDESSLRIHARSFGIVAGICLLFTIKTVLRNPDWYSSQTLMMADALEGSSNSARIYYNAGIIVSERLSPNDPELIRFPRADSAKAFLEKAISIDPKYAEAHFQLGVVNYRRNNYAASVQNFFNARRCNPLMDVDGNLGDALQQAGMYDSAVAARRRVLKSPTVIPLSRVKLAESLLPAGDTLEAIEVLKTGTTVDRSNINNWIFLGNVYGMHRNYSDSRNVLEEAMKIQPDNEDVIKALFTSCTHLGDTARCKQLNEIYARLKARPPVKQ